jgi:hypothetical protein
MIVIPREVIDVVEAFKQFVGWFIVAILVLTLILMTIRTRRTRIQKVTYGLIIAFNLIIARSIYRTHFKTLAGFPEPVDFLMWVTTVVLLWRFFWFVIVMPWLYPTVYGYASYARLWLYYQHERHRQIMRGTYEEDCFPPPCRPDDTQ